MSAARGKILGQVSNERDAQDAKWGEQNHPDISPRIRMSEGMATHPRALEIFAKQVARYYGVPHVDVARASCDHEHRAGHGSWFSIHVEELGEALEQAALGDTDRMRAELVQLAATVTAHIEAIDRRKS